MSTIIIFTNLPMITKGGSRTWIISIQKSRLSLIMKGQKLKDLFRCLMKSLIATLMLARPMKLSMTHLLVIHVQLLLILSFIPKNTGKSSTGPRQRPRPLTRLILASYGTDLLSASTWLLSRSLIRLSRTQWLTSRSENKISNMRGYPEKPSFRVIMRSVLPSLRKISMRRRQFLKWKDLRLKG